MLTIHATATKYIGLLESPAPLKILLITLYAIIKGNPIKHIYRYSLASVTASGGVDITLTIPLVHIKSTAVITIANAVKK